MKSALFIFLLACVAAAPSTRPSSAEIQNSLRQVEAELATAKSSTMARMSATEEFKATMKAIESKESEYPRIVRDGSPTEQSEAMRLLMAERSKLATLKLAAQHDPLIRGLEERAKNLRTQLLEQKDLEERQAAKRGGEAAFRRNHPDLSLLKDKIAAIRSREIDSSLKGYSSYAARAAKAIDASDILVEYANLPESRWKREEFASLAKDALEVMLDWKQSLTGEEKDYPSFKLLINTANMVEMIALRIEARASLMDMDKRPDEPASIYALEADIITRRTLLNVSLGLERDVKEFSEKLQTARTVIENRESLQRPAPLSQSPMKKSA